LEPFCAEAGEGRKALGVDFVKAELTELERLARQGGALAQEERHLLRRELKVDGSIVTSADRAVESMLRDELPKLVSDAGIWGEEFGLGTPGSGGLWTVDPIDGTSNFTFGSPMWGVAIALVQADGVKMSAIFLADLNEMFLFAEGLGVTLNGQALPAIASGVIEPYQLVSAGDYVQRTVTHIPGKLRLSGAAVVDASFTACQRFRGLVGKNERLYDVAPGMGMLQSLDADLRYLDGAPIDYVELMKGERIAKPWVGFPKGSGFYG